MACPFFHPGRPIDDAGRWTHAPRMPLGEACHGTCRAQPSESFEPSEGSLLELCNWGYARGRCDRFPPDAPADAVRFSIAAEDQRSVRLIYVLERDHAPVEHGVIECSFSSGGFALEGTAVMHADALLLFAQARAFLESHLGKVGQALSPAESS